MSKAIELARKSKTMLVDEHYTNGVRFAFLPEELESFYAAAKAEGAREEREGKETFEQAWQRKKDEGYQYGRDALEQVRFGFKIARGEA